MKRVQFRQTGNPLEVLELVDVPIPEPGPGELRLRMIARPINPSDLLYVQGLYGVRPRLPSLVGFEGVGVLDACGPGVPLPRGIRIVATSVGTWQDYMIIPGSSGIPVPPDIPDEIAAQFFVNPLSAWAMVDLLGLKEGQWLMLSAAGSALGQLVVQIAQQKGIKTLCTVRRDDQRATLEDLGADVVLNTEQEDIVARALEVTGHRGVQAALDAVGGPVGGRLMQCLTRGGTLLTYGLLSGEPLPLDVGAMIFRNLTVKGFWLQDWIRLTPPAVRQQTIDTVMEQLRQGHLHPPVEASYPLTALSDAIRHASKPGRSGKVLLAG